MYHGVSNELRSQTVLATDFTSFVKGQQSHLVVLRTLLDIELSAGEFFSSYMHSVLGDGVFNSDGWSSCYIRPLSLTNVHGVKVKCGSESSM